MKQNRNSRRINKIAREKLASILLFEVSDPDLALVTLTSVEVSVDKSVLKAYVSCDSSLMHTIRCMPPTSTGPSR